MSLQLSQNYWEFQSCHYPNEEVFIEKLANFVVQIKQLKFRRRSTMKRLVFILFLALAMLLAACGGGAATETPVAPAPDEEQATEEPMPEEEEAMDAIEIRFTFYADGNEADVMQGLLDEFMAENPGITVVLDVVPYAPVKVLTWHASPTLAPTKANYWICAITSRTQLTLKPISQPQSWRPWATAASPMVSA
jgi:hypothetical protein